MIGYDWHTGNCCGEYFGTSRQNIHHISSLPRASRIFQADVKKVRVVFQANRMEQEPHPASGRFLTRKG
jgi:hypothetical protein